jgi:hypothetical protein
LHEPCLCDPLDDCCLTDASGHHTGCPRRRAYFTALQQAVVWKRMAQVIRLDLLPVEG